MQKDNIFYVNVPTQPIYNMLGEISDELLFGWKVTTIGEQRDERIYCKTDYGYSGYISTKALSKTGGGEYVVTSRFCPALKKPDYASEKLFLLPYGARLTVTENSGKFSRAEYENGEFFIPSVHISEIKKTPPTVQNILDTASVYLNTPYVWGGKSTFGIDCSGLCFMAYYLNGIKIYRDSCFSFYEEYAKDMCDLKPCDLVFYKGHVALYIGNGKIIHSNSRDGMVTVGDVNHAEIAGCADMEKIVRSQTYSNVMNTPSPLSREIS